MQCVLCQVKKMGHDHVQGHGAGKKYMKIELERIMREMVLHNVFREDVNKSDFYGGLSVNLKVR